eukprot:TRINITY_DN68041_c1_g3_i7.p3 TRINITY_DN68041_c1_g3~~TRINITY_DN68041_c1_g3_i7.p3  ORF type:complete len:102 (+),score=9.51 TRINITY_DN68041_c1_g3_i7:821-1126(+)
MCLFASFYFEAPCIYHLFCTPFHCNWPAGSQRQGRAPLQANIAIQNQAATFRNEIKIGAKKGKLGCIKAKLDKKSAENVELQQNLVVERVGAQNLRAPAAP